MLVLLMVGITCIYFNGGILVPVPVCRLTFCDMKRRLCRSCIKSGIVMFLVCTIASIVMLFASCIVRISGLQYNEVRKRKDNDTKMKRGK